MSDMKSHEIAVEGEVPVELHPLKPFLPQGAKVLMLGSFPPKRERWSMDFFYPNFNNDMWRIMGLVFFGDRDHFIVPGQKRFDREAVVGFCTACGIALFDVANAVRRLRDNASDAFLEIAEPTDIAALLAEIPSCRAVIATGGKAAEAVSQCFGCALPPVGSSVDVTLSDRNIAFCRMPSSSRAYPASLDTKAAAYRRMFSDLRVIVPAEKSLIL